MADTSSKSSFEKLKAGEWFNWSFRMELRLAEKGLWDIISGAEERPESGVKKQEAYDKRARTCIAELVRHVEDSELPHIRRYWTPPQPWDAWQRLREMHEGRGWATRIQLRRKFITAQMEPGSTMQQHINYVNELAERLGSIGSPIDEEDVLLVLLASVPPSFDNVVVALETNHTTLTVDLVTSALLNEERRQSDNQERAETSKFALVADSRPRRDKSQITCFNCGKRGHYRSDCPTFPSFHTRTSEARIASTNSPSSSDSAPLQQVSRAMTARLESPDTDAIQLF